MKNFKIEISVVGNYIKASLEGTSIDYSGATVTLALRGLAIKIYKELDAKLLQEINDYRISQIKEMNDIVYSSRDKESNMDTCSIPPSDYRCAENEKLAPEKESLKSN